MMDAQQHRACFIVGGAHHSCEEIVELEAAHESCEATIKRFEQERDEWKAAHEALELCHEEDNEKLEQAKQRLSEVAPYVQHLNMECGEVQSGEVVCSCGLRAVLEAEERNER